jgi:hypothetical protein
MKAASFYNKEGQSRRAALVNLTLTDLFIVVLFVLLLFTFRAGDEGRIEISALEEQLRNALQERDMLRDQLTKSQANIAMLEKKVRELDELINRLLGARKDPTLPVDPKVEIAALQDIIRKQKDEIARLKAIIASKDGLLESQQADLGAKEKQLASQGKGTGHPRCLVTSGYLFDIRLLGSGDLSISAAWESGADQAARRVSGVTELISASEVTLDTFQQQGKRILAWSNEQEIPCRFRVKTTRETKDLDLYLRQMRLIDQVFYPTRY